MSFLWSCQDPQTWQNAQRLSTLLLPSLPANFAESFDTLYYYRHVTPEQIDQVLQAHSEGASLQGVSRISGLAYNTMVSIICAASSKALLVHNHRVQAVETEEVSGDEMWSFVQKKQKHCLPEELEVGDCWIAVSLADSSGLILAAHVGNIRTN